jgi:Tfp pilus tip-associated adhesin PilY1
VLIVGGDRGNSSSGDLTMKASGFLNVFNGHRVPVYVILLSTTATTDTERTDLQAIASASGGQFFEVTPSDVASVAAGQPVPKLVRAVNIAISHAFVDQGTFDKAPDATRPYGYSTEFQVTSPIVGTVNLANAKDIVGNVLPNTVIPPSGTVIPQRSNVMLTTGFSLPGYTAALRAFRVYTPVEDSTKASGYQFKADGTRLWVACSAGTAGTPCASTPVASRNIYTATADGTVVAFTSANAATLQSYLGASTVAQAQTLIEYIRSQPLGAVVDSTPAFMDPPSLDPPPDSDYPAFSEANKGRRSIIWVGANDGMLHAIDGRLGQEVWAFIPFNLLPKLETLRSGQPTGDFRFFVDGSPKVADVKIGGTWRTYLVMGEGPGGTFYQTFDVTLDNMANTVASTSDDISSVLTYFANATVVPLKWEFPRYSSFDWSCTATGRCPRSQWGDLFSTASAVEKTVGQTWSDPAIGQVESPSGQFTVLTGSGFFKYSREQDANRGGIVAGTTFYLLDAATGAVLDSRDVGSDKKAETVDDCTTAAKGCMELKNALQADPVATGAADSRFISKAYLGDLDGKIWRFDIGLDTAMVPKIKQLVSLTDMGTLLKGTASNHPIFSSMATVNVGGAQQYLFVGTGSDLLPSTGVSVQYALVVVLDQGTTGSKAGAVMLEKTDSLAGDEKVSAFPAVAGDIVFFSTTTYQTAACTMPNANLYAFTFIGGPAYDTTNDGRVTTADSTKIRTTTGARASAPFIVDQHLVFATGNQIEMFGDPTDFNNGVGQVGVRILSWREVR